MALNWFAHICVVFFLHLLGVRESGPPISLPPPIPVLSARPDDSLVCDHQTITWKTGKLGTYWEARNLHYWILKVKLVKQKSMSFE